MQTFLGNILAVLWITYQCLAGGSEGQVPGKLVSEHIEGWLLGRAGVMGEVSIVSGGSVAGQR